MNLHIRIEDPAWKAVPELRKRARAAIMASLEDHDVSLSVLFTDDAAMRALNARWRGQDKSTNVLSFPSAQTHQISGEPRQLGDIALAYGVVASEAAAQSKPVHQHAAHLLVHGVMHLLGYDHETDHQAHAMEAREIAILKSLGIDNPYA